jgi:dTDP-4-dehydrorhamnose reductase
MRVLVTGAGGQLGRDLVATCEAAGDEVVAMTREQLDVGDRASVARAVPASAPHVVVNCAAWTAVDACESDQQRAFRDNGAAVGWLRTACDAVGAHLVQIGTDYVFDGTLDRPYREDDATNPQSVYGASKLDGELRAGASATIVRTSWVCGAGGGNMVKTVLRMLDNATPMAFVDDQRGCPSFTADLAVTIRELAARRLPGVFHVTNQRAVTWYEFVREIVEAAGGDPDVVRPITTAELVPPRPAPRPSNSVLENAAIVAAGMPLLRDHSEPLAELVALLRN